MPRRALIEHRPWLLASMALALAYWLLSDSKLGELYLLLLKAGSVAALPAYALARSRHRDARHIAAVMATGAMGDAFIELDTIAGGAWFLLAHLLAIALYWRRRRAAPSVSQRAAAASVLAGVPLCAWLLTDDPLAAVYAVALAAMAASAWLSRFSRYAVGVGALLFVASDLLIFARLGGTLSQSVTSWLIWPMYYAGQLLIVTGVIRTVRRDHQA